MKWFLIFITTCLISCASNSHKYNETIEVFKYSNSVQCMPYSGIDIDDMKLELTDNNITILSYYSDCDGKFYPMSCGLPTGEIYIFEIYREYFDIFLRNKKARPV